MEEESKLVEEAQKFDPEFAKRLQAAFKRSQQEIKRKDEIIEVTNFFI